MPADSSEALRAVDAVCRMESSRVIARIARMVRDVGMAEELAQDAFVAALEQWPASGIPDNPGAWLTSVAKRRAVDRIRRERNFASKEDSIGYEAEASRLVSGKMSAGRSNLYPQANAVIDVLCLSRTSLGIAKTFSFPP